LGADAFLRGKSEEASMAQGSHEQLADIRQSLGEIHARADQSRHLVETIRDCLLPELEATAGFKDEAGSTLAVAHSLLGLVGELAGDINCHAERIGRAEVHLRA
jgi:hypothetical protein